MPPPPSQRPFVRLFIVCVTVVASGVVDDYLDDSLERIAARVAAELNVDRRTVSIELIGASVQLQMSINQPTAQLAAATFAILNRTLSNSTAASAFLGILVTEKPMIQVRTVPPWQAPSLPPMLPPEMASEATMLDVLAVVIISVVGLLCIGLVYHRAQLNADTSSASGPEPTAKLSTLSCEPQPYAQATQVSSAASTSDGDVHTHTEPKLAKSRQLPLAVELPKPAVMGEVSPTLLSTPSMADRRVVRL